jgi:hypothetical protein
MSDKFKTMLEIPSVKKFTRNRDDLIKILDKIKFILDNGYDVKIDNGKTYKSTFTTPIDFYSSVKPCIDYINENTNKMYSKLDTSINFLTPTYNDSLVQDIIQTFYYNDRTNIINELLKVAQSDIDVSVVNGINNKLIKVFYKASNVNIKFQKSPKPKNDNAIKYIINSEILDTTTNEIKEIFSGNIKTKKVVENESVKNNFVLYPNPSANLLNIKGDFDAEESVTIYNMLGQTVLTKAVFSNDQSIDITSLAKGIYNVYFNNAKVSYKFIKE